MPGITLAGTYGIEVKRRDATIVRRVDPQRIRPQILKIKSAWRKLIAPHSGFLLEDKGLAVALHARFAKPQERAVVIPSAQVIARQVICPTDFRILADVDFLEVAPALANKGKTVAWLLSRAKLRNEMLLYFGDDDKDEEALQLIRRKGGYGIQVGNRYRLKHANLRLGSPNDVRQWLELFVHSVQST